MTGFESSNAYARHAKVRLRHDGKWTCRTQSQDRYAPCGSGLARESGGPATWMSP